MPSPTRSLPDAVSLALCAAPRRVIVNRMTWLRDAPADPLTAQSRTYDLWRLTLREADRIADARLLDRCKARLAETYDRGPVVDDASLAPDELAAVTFADQQRIDQNGLTEAHHAALGEAVGSEHVRDFAFAVYTWDADFRARTLLGVADGPPPLAEAPEKLDEGHLFPMPGVDLAYSEALGRFGNDACRRSLVDDVTSEACRLRNAKHQGCHY